jgi:hypothetical protein
MEASDSPGFLNYFGRGFRARSQVLLYSWKRLAAAVLLCVDLWCLKSKWTGAYKEPWPIGAAVTNYHRLGETESLRTGCQDGWVLVESSSKMQTSNFCCILISQKERPTSLISYEGTNPIHEGSTLTT